MNNSPVPAGLFIPSTKPFVFLADYFSLLLPLAKQPAPRSQSLLLFTLPPHRDPRQKKRKRKSGERLRPSTPIFFHLFPSLFCAKARITSRLASEVTLSVFSNSRGTPRQAGEFLNSSWRYTTSASRTTAGSCRGRQQ